MMQLFVLNTRSFWPMKYDWDSLTYEGDGLDVDKLCERVKLLKIAVASHWAGCTNKALWSIIFQFSGHKKNKRTLFQSLKRGIYLRKTPWIKAGRVSLNVDTEAWERCREYHAYSPTTTPHRTPAYVALVNTIDTGSEAYLP